jgi:hypothetical protein
MASCNGVELVVANTPKLGIWEYKCIHILSTYLYTEQYHSSWQEQPTPEHLQQSPFSEMGGAFFRLWFTIC